MVGKPQVVVRTEHQDLAAPQADLARLAAFVTFEDLEPEVQPRVPEILGAGEVPALLEQVVMGLGAAPATCH